MKGVSVHILTDDTSESKFLYTVHSIHNGEYSTRPPKPLEAENWDVLPYSDYP